MKTHDPAPAVTGHFYLEVRDSEGRIVEVVDEPNLVVIGARQTLARLLGGDGANRSVTQIGFGTNGTAPVTGNTSLTGQYAKALDTISFPNTDRVQFNFSLGVGENNGVAIAEFGLLTAAGVLFARKTRATPLNKDSDLSFTGSWTIIFS